MGGLITQFRGQVKSGKTLSMVAYGLQVASRIGRAQGARCQIFTNMKECRIRDKNHPEYGAYWAEHVEVDDLIDDMRVHRLSDAKFKLGLLLWDEAHEYWDTNSMRGTAGKFLTRFIAQAGKRGMPIIYTTHMQSMVAPRVRRLTEIASRCWTSDHGRIVHFETRDEESARMSADEGYPPPPLLHHVIDNRDGWFFKLYDTNEVIWDDTVVASPSMKKALKDLDKRRERLAEPKPLDEDQRKQFLEQAEQASKETLEEMSAKNKKPARQPLPTRQKVARRGLLARRE